MQFLSTRQKIFITDRKSVINLINRTNYQQLHIYIINNPVRKQLFLIGNCRENGCFLSRKAL